MYNTITLDNGLRVIHRTDSSPIVYCGFQIAAGTRHEAPGQEGLAHFVEHMSFKGTKRRTALQVINTLESVGGELNAFTGKETTVYYAAFGKEHLKKAIDLLCDIVFHSTYPQAEITKEVEVICDEIESYNDSPSELIFDDFENIIFKNHPLGHNILGTADNVRSFTTADARAFADRYYTPENMIFFCSGDVEMKDIIRKMTFPAPSERKGELVGSITQERNGDGLGNHSPLLSQGVGEAFSPNDEVVRRLATHQAHVMLGTRAYGMHHEGRLALYLLNNILGGPGMNARLNLALREKNGLVYTVESTMVNYADTGLWSVYFGCDAHDVKRCLRLVRRELDRLMRAPLSEKHLNAAKRQIKGQIALSCDNRENFAIDFGKSFLHFGIKRDVAKLYADIDALTADQLHAVACEIFAPERLTTLIYK